MKRLTREREKEIRDYIDVNCWIFKDEHLNTLAINVELLSEIDALRTDKDKLSTDLVNREARLHETYEERDQLKAQAIEREKTNQQLTSEIIQLVDENDKLRERMAKLREGLKFYARLDEQDIDTPNLRREFGCGCCAGTNNSEGDV